MGRQTMGVRTTMRVERNAHKHDKCFRIVILLEDVPKTNTKSLYTKPVTIQSVKTFCQLLKIYSVASTVDERKIFVDEVTLTANTRFAFDEIGRLGSNRNRWRHVEKAMRPQFASPKLLSPVV